jgi:hypothetical protein
MELSMKAVSLAAASLAAAIAITASGSAMAQTPGASTNDTLGANRRRGIPAAAECAAGGHAL